MVRRISSLGTSELFQQTLGRFAAEREVVGVTVSTSQVRDRGSLLEKWDIDPPLGFEGVSGSCP